MTSVGKNEGKIETKVETAIPKDKKKDDKKLQGTLHPNYKDDVDFRKKWRDNENFRKGESSRFGWTDDEARGIIVRESGWVKPKPGYKPCCCGNDCADVFYITGTLLALYVVYGLFFVAMFYFWSYAANYALYTFFVLMFVYWTTVGLLVYFGSVEVEKNTQMEFQ